MATIRRTTQPHQFLLAVTRVYEEGEEALADDDDDQDRKSPFSPKVFFLKKIVNDIHDLLPSSFFFCQ